MTLFLLAIQIINSIKNYEFLAKNSNLFQKLIKRSVRWRYSWIISDWKRQGQPDIIQLSVF